MQNEEIITEESLLGTEQNVPASSSEPAVSQGEDALSLSEIESTLGKKFPDKNTALKALKDTFSYVGKLGNEVKTLKEQIAPSVAPPQELVQKVESLERTVKETQFYKEHPEYEAYKDLIASMGQDPQQVTQSEVFKTYFSKAKTADSYQQSKSVLHTNPRLGQVTDKITQAREAQKTGDHTAASRSAVSAVLDAFEAK